jgi:DNA modification methylase
VAANVLAHGTGALNIDECRIGYQSEADMKANDVKSPGERPSKDTTEFWGGVRVSNNPAGRWPANVILDESQAENLGDESRFFYTAKASTHERPRIDGSAHPTVKPLDLMRYLVRLVTPPGGTVLEPFAGSGTTAEACIVEGFKCIAIEREAEYLPLIVQRVSKPIQVTLL